MSCTQCDMNNGDHQPWCPNRGELTPSEKAAQEVTREQNRNAQKTVFDWAYKHRYIFVSRSYGEYTTAPVSLDALEELVKMARGEV